MLGVSDLVVVVTGLDVVPTGPVRLTVTLFDLSVDHTRWMGALILRATGPVFCLTGPVPLVLDVVVIGPELPVFPGPDLLRDLDLSRNLANIVGLSLTQELNVWQVFHHEGVHLLKNVW